MLRTAGGATRHFLHDPDGHLLAEATSAGITTTEWLWLDDTPLALVADADTASPRLYWLHTDQLGTPQQLTDTAGNLVWDQPIPVGCERPYGVFGIRLRSSLAGGCPVAGAAFGAAAAGAGAAAGRGAWAARLGRP